MAFTGNTPCNAFRLAQWNGGINFATDSYYLALYTNAATLGVDTPVYTTVGEVVAAGYAAGGVPLTVSVQPVASGSGVFMSFADAVVNAALTARGALIYKNAATKTAVAVLDFGADKTSRATFTVHFPAATLTDAILRLR